MAPADNSQKLLKQRLIAAQSPDGAVSDQLVPGKVQQEASEPENVLYELETPFRVSPPELSSEIAGCERFADQRHGGLDAFQSESHSLSSDGVEEPRAVADEKKPGPVARLDGKAQRPHCE